MPTPHSAFAAVAAVLADIDPSNDEAVEVFYRRRFTSFPPPVRALISDFLTGLSGMPSIEELKRLKDTIALPLSELPQIEAPVWDAAFGPPMEYNLPPEPAVAAGGTRPASDVPSYRRAAAEHQRPQGRGDTTP